MRAVTQVAVFESTANQLSEREIRAPGCSTASTHSCSVRVVTIEIIQVGQPVSKGLPVEITGRFGVQTESRRRQMFNFGRELRSDE